MPNLPGSFSAYPVSVVLDGSGNGTVMFGPNGSNCRITNLFGRVSTTTKQAVATIYQGYIGANYQLDNSNSGSTGFKASGNIDLHDGEVCYVQWVGGDPGATATATFTGIELPFDQLTASQFAVDDNFAAGDGTIIYPALQSPNYVPGVSGWIIRRDGSFELGSGGVFRGNVDVVGADGTRIQINASGGTAIIRLTPPPPAVGSVTGTGFIVSGINNNVGTAGQAFTQINSPFINTGSGDVNNGQLVIRSAPGNNPTGTPSLAFNGNVNVDGNVSAGPDLGDLGHGQVSYAGASSASPSGAIAATETAVLTTPSTIFRANRAFRVKLAGRLAVSVANSAPQLAVRKTNAAGQALCSVGRLSQIATSEFVIPNPDIVFTVGAADITAPICFTLTGSGTFTVTQTGNRWMSVFDVGPAANYPDAVVMV